MDRPDRPVAVYMKVSITYLNTFILGCGLIWRMASPVGPWPLYESLYNLLNYFHYWLWTDLEDNIPSRPVAVIANADKTSKRNAGYIP